MKIAWTEISIGIADCSEVEQELLKELGFEKKQEKDVWGSQTWGCTTEFMVSRDLDCRLVTPNLVLSSTGRIFLKMPDGSYAGTDGRRYLFDQGYSSLKPAG